MKKYKKLLMQISLIFTLVIVSNIGIKQANAAYILENMVGGYTIYSSSIWGNYSQDIPKDIWYKTVTYTGPNLGYRDRVSSSKRTLITGGYIDKNVYVRDYYSY